MIFAGLLFLNKLINSFFKEFDLKYNNTKSSVFRKAFLKKKHIYGQRIIRKL